jgi:hypothetical protein
LVPSDIIEEEEETSNLTADSGNCGVFEFQMGLLFMVWF